MPSSTKECLRSSTRVAGFRSVKRIDIFVANSADSLPVVGVVGEVGIDEFRQRTEQKSQTKQLKSVTLKMTNTLIEY